MASAAIVLTTDSRFFARELHVQPDLAVAIEARLEVRESDLGGQRALQAREQRRPREAPLRDDLREAAALLGESRELVGRHGGLRRVRLPVGAELAILERGDLRARVRDLAPVLREEAQVRDEQRRAEDEERHGRDVDGTVVLERSPREVEVRGSSSTVHGGEPGEKLGPRRDPLVEGAVRREEPPGEGRRPARRRRPTLSSSRPGSSSWT